MGPSDLHLFLSQVANHWVAFIMGSAVMAVIAIIERAIKPLPTLVYIAAIVLGGTVFATYGAWQDEHRLRTTAEGAARTLQGQIDALDKPIITGQIRQRFLMKSTDIANPVQLYVAEVEVVNSGAPTILTDWNVGIISDQGVVIGVNCVMPEKLEGSGPFGFKVRILREYMLQEKTSQPIERGAMRTGWLIIQMPSNDEVLRLWKKGALLQAVAKDAFGHTVVINYVGQGPTVQLTKEDMMRYSPGSEQIFSPPSPAHTAIPKRRDAR
jgi:hypothetical protein